MSKMVLRPLSNIAIRLASRTPNRVFSRVTVSPIFSARTCASVTGVSRMWWVMAEHRRCNGVPLPLVGRGQGWGWPQLQHQRDPPPQPSPTRGEGARPAALHWYVFARSTSPEIDPARRDHRVGAAGGVALDVH